MATIIAFPEFPSDAATSFENLLLHDENTLGQAARADAVERLLNSAFDQAIPLAQRLDLAGHLAAAYGSRELCERVLPLLGDPSPEGRQVAALILGFDGNLRAIFPLVALLDDDNFAVRRCAVIGLAGIRDPHVLTFLLGVLDRDDGLVATALSSLRLFPLAQTQAVFASYLDSADAELALLALGAFLFADPAAAAPIARRFVDHADPRHRGLAVSILERAGCRADLELLFPLLGDDDHRVRRLVADAIAALRR